MRLFISVVVLAFLAGCQTAPKPKPVDSGAETIAAMTTVAQGLTNKSISEDQLKRVAKQVANDPQAQSALSSINTAFNPDNPEHTVKYCPEDGTRYNANQIWCPDHKVKLEWVE